jgi:hypothetical protein
MCTFMEAIPLIAAAVAAGGGVAAAKVAGDAQEKAATRQAEATKKAAATNAAALTEANKNASTVPDAVTGTVAKSPVRADDDALTIGGVRKASTAARIGTRSLRSDLTISGLNLGGGSGSGLNA